jgi:hypothetical protein
MISVHNNKDLTLSELPGKSMDILNYIILYDNIFIDGSLLFHFLYFDDLLLLLRELDYFI